MDRRKFLKIMGMASAATAVPWQARGLAQILKPRPLFAQSQLLTKFIQPMPLFGIPVAGTTPIPVAAADTTTFPGVNYYQLGMAEFTQLLHPELPKETKLWGYFDENPASPNFNVKRLLGGAIIATGGPFGSAVPVRAKFRNHLPAVPIMPIDTTISGAETGQLPNRTAVHNHGGQVFWTSDGGPFAWFAANGTHGPDWLTNDYWYPNEMSARLGWYHDHALGITRLNAYAGLASGYIITDTVEAGLIGAGMLPGLLTPYTVHMVIEDKIFKQEFDQWGAPGDLWYPYLYDTARWQHGAGFPNAPVPSNIPEMFGDTVLVNGAVSPFNDITADFYRLRILNACNARFMRLRLYHAKGATPPLSTEANTALPGPTFRHIATEGGWLNARHGVVESQLILGPAERADLLIDFTGAAVGDIFILYNNAPAPFPSGDPLNDYKVGNKMVSPYVASGFAPDSRNILQFRVVGTQVNPSLSPLTLPVITPALPYAWNTQTMKLGIVIAQTRALTINEDFDDYGRLLQRMGTNTVFNPNTFGRNFQDPPTEMPVAGSWEVWEFYNLTGDTHPIHFHLVNVQIMNRQPFNVAAFIANPAVPVFTGAAKIPPTYERSWKETVRMNPGEVTRVVMQFNLPLAADPQFPNGQPFSPRLQQAYGINGYEYVYHCHILDHEEHDMMRPMVVV